MRTRKTYNYKTDPVTKEHNAVTWLMQHPEDIPLARENLAYRDKGFDNDGIRQMMAAMCLKACIDYKHATSPYVIGTKKGEHTIDDCRKFFGGDIFQFFVNGMKVEEIEKHIRRTPEGAIQSMWKNMEAKKAAMTEE